MSECATCAIGRASPGGCPFREVRAPAGTLLVEQGEPPEQVWWLREGTVLISSTRADGEECACALRGPGTLLGMEALRGRPTDHQAWALSDVVLCRVGAGAFARWADGAHALVVDQLLDESARRGEERSALRGRALARVARFLVERRRIEGGDRPLHVEQQLLSRMLGMRSETLSRALNRLRELGALWPRRGVVVRDAATLERIAGEPE
jgi:CRP-like cAMP-binding protein